MYDEIVINFFVNKLYLDGKHVNYDGGKWKCLKINFY